jgi:hypothetical protein
MEDELETLNSEMLDFFEIWDEQDTMVPKISNSTCTNWQQPSMKYLELSEYYQGNLDFYCGGYNFEVEKEQYQVFVLTMCLIAAGILLSCMIMICWMVGF